MTASVTLAGIHHAFGDFHALRGIDLEIGAGEYVTLLGPSGCGKTTLLSILGGFLAPTRGRVLIGGEDITALAPAKRPTTTVFQDYALFPHMSLRDNVAFGLRMAGVGRRERHARAERFLALVGLDGAAGKRPDALSGGQRQRVALARALAVEPQVLLLDEPLGALDMKLRRAMQDELKAIQREVGTTFVHVTHDQEEAMAISDRIVLMNAGRIEDAGTPARVYRQPATLFAADFMGETNRIPGTATAEGIDTAFGNLAVAHGCMGPVTLCLRPSALRIGAGDLALGRGIVRSAAFFGQHGRVQLEPEAIPGGLLTAHVPPDALPAVGETVSIGAEAQEALVYARKE